MLQTSLSEEQRQFARDVELGLSGTSKFLHPKYFYDALGSRLFELITQQPEYYPTRVEASILRECAPKIASLMGDEVSLVELGSGSSVKTTILLDSLLEESDRTHYVPIDISPSILRETADRLDARYPDLGVTPIASQYESGLEKASALVSEDASVPDRMLVLFLGSSIGNMEPEEALDFLTRIRESLAHEDALLIGLDLVKDRDVLEAAYNDAAGVTARFNLNILGRINRELEASFDLDRFSHRAFFNETESRIEMHLLSETDQRVRVGALGQSFDFAREETIHTESSHKYTRAWIEEWAARTGFRVQELFTDERSWFALALFTPV
jgi:L-histidine N-alpha-methyltransferase